VLIIDSTAKGEAEPLHHSIYAIMYVPSWLRIRQTFNWSHREYVMQTLETMQEYFVASELEERPIRAQRCFYSLRSLHIYGYKKDGLPFFDGDMRKLLSTRLRSLTSYLQDNPVVAWDWVVSWAESRAMAEAYPGEYVRLYRRLRSVWTSKRQPKPELLYFINLLEEVAKEKDIDMEHKWNSYG